MMTSLLLAAALAFTPADAKFASCIAEEFLNECTPREAGTIRGSLAASWLLNRASLTGADVRRDIFTAETPKGPKRFINLYATFKSNPTNRWVVLVSHYDTKKGVPGANDGASTSALLVALTDILERAEAKTLTGNVMLAWVDAEESLGEHYAENDGLQGSRRAAEHLREMGVGVQAVICLDMLGDKDLGITVPANGTKTLARIARHAARRIGEKDLVTISDLPITDDHVPFLDAGFPAIDLIDFDYGPDNRYWHTADDTFDKISEESLLKSGRLVCEILNILL